MAQIPTALLEQIKQRVPISREDDFSCDPSKWSVDKLSMEKKHGMPAVLAEYERRFGT